jgi:predicted ATPase
VASTPAIRILARESGAGHAQFIVATHSPILLACPVATIWSFDEAPPHRIAYVQTGLVSLYRGFFADPEKHLRDAATPHT